MSERLKRWNLIAPILLVVASCGSDPTAIDAPDGYVDNLVTAEIRSDELPPTFPLGSSIPVTMHNLATTVATVGALGCVSELEVRNRRAGRWQRLVSLRACIEIAISVEGGTDYEFEVPPPDGTGEYRVVFEAYFDGRLVTVRTGEFTVE